MSYINLRVIRAMDAQAPGATLDEYKQLIADYDWYYSYSDDHRVWQRGEASREKIKEVYQRLSDVDKQAAYTFFEEKKPKDFNPVEFSQFKGMY